MTEAHVAADAKCASRLAELGERFRAWSTLSRLMVERDELQAGAIATAAYQIAVLEGRRCFDAFLAVEYAILADRRAKVREMDSELYKITGGAE